MPELTYLTFYAGVIFTVTFRHLEKCKRNEVENEGKNCLNSVNCFRHLNGKAKKIKIPEELNNLLRLGVFSTI